MIKWIHSVIDPQQARADVIEQGSEEERKARKETKLIDVAHEVLRKRSQRLDGIVNEGGSNVDRKEFKGKVKKKVWDTVDENFGFSDDEMVEEITERVVDAADADPFYKKLFE